MTVHYTEEELQQMQQEAVRRVKEMQERARRTALEGGWAGSSLPTAVRQAEPAPQPPAPAEPPPRPAQQGSLPQPSTGAAGGLFRGQTSSPLGGLMQWAGGERGILLALLAVLMGEGADPSLLLALFYLAMFDDDQTPRGPAEG